MNLLTGLFFHVLTFILKKEKTHQNARAQPSQQNN